MVWKKIPVKVIEICFLEDKFCLSLIVSNNQHKVPNFVLPCNKNGEIMHHDSVLLAIPETNYLVKVDSDEPIYIYISAHINEIKDSKEYDAVCIKGNLVLGLSEILKGRLHIELKKDKDWELIRIPIKSSQKKYSINATLAAISKSWKNKYDRFFYKRAGGIEMVLVKNHE